MLLVDTNVLVDVLEDDPAWADWSIAQLRAQAQVHALAINPVIYAELSLAFEDLVVVGAPVRDQQRASVSFEKEVCVTHYLPSYHYCKTQQLLSCGTIVE